MVIRVRQVVGRYDLHMHRTVHCLALALGCFMHLLYMVKREVSVIPLCHERKMMLNIQTYKGLPYEGSQKHATVELERHHLIQSPLFKECQ